MLFKLEIRVFYYIVMVSLVDMWFGVFWVIEFVNYSVYLDKEMVKGR